MPPLSEKTQAAYDAWKDAKARVKTARDAVKDAQANDAALQDAADKKQQAAEEYSSERFQWDGKHAHLLESLADVKAEEKEAHLFCTDCYTTALQTGVQLSLFDGGRAVEVTVSTKAKVTDATPANDEEPSEPEA